MQYHVLKFLNIVLWICSNTKTLEGFHSEFQMIVTVYEAADFPMAATTTIIPPLHALVNKVFGHPGLSVLAQRNVETTEQGQRHEVAAEAFASRPTRTRPLTNLSQNPAIDATVNGLNGMKVDVYTIVAAKPRAGHESRNLEKPKSKLLRAAQTRAFGTLGVIGPSVQLAAVEESKHDRPAAMDLNAGTALTTRKRVFTIKGRINELATTIIVFATKNAIATATEHLPKNCSMPKLVVNARVTRDGKHHQTFLASKLSATSLHSVTPVVTTSQWNHNVLTLQTMLTMTSPAKAQIRQMILAAKSATGMMI